MAGIVALDIGGTKISAGVFRPDGVMRTRSEAPTEARQGPDAVVERICRTIREALALAGEETPEAIGVACPGPLSPSRGEVIFAPTLGWRNLPITRRISQQFDCPVILENDANAAAYGEYRLGAGRGSSSLAYLTVSTGVGCGLVLDGKILQGFHESAGEFGHLNVVPEGGRPCLCGRTGCLEAYASGTGIAAMARERMKIEPTALSQYASVTAREVAQCAQEGDALCLSIYREAGEKLGRGIAALQMLVDIECVVLGGSVVHAFDLFAPSLVRTVEALSYWGAESEKWLRKARLAPDAGLVGAALLAAQAL